jgi:hypothetical protein
MKKKIAGIAFVLLSILIMSVSAYVYISADQTVTQRVRRVVSTFVLKNSDLGDLFEAETKSYTKDGTGGTGIVPDLGAAISITTAKTGVFLYLVSDIDALAPYYSVYTLTVTFASVPVGSTHTVGSNAATLTIANPYTPVGITLDAAGAYTFDFALTTTAGTVVSDTTTIATITVSAENV